MFAAGTVIAHFTLEKEIGRGGQGAVYRAEDQRSGKKVALKVLRVGTEVPYKMFERFQREADITRKLDHPGICAVYENGTEGDIAWISMRLLTGQPLARTWAPPPETPNEMMLFESDAGGVKVRTISTLSTVTPPPAQNILQSTPLVNRGTAAAVREAARVVESCARALHAAHEVGVIHRDVKPSNIMITASGDPVILDFGLARDGGEDNLSLTMSGTAVGTPSYMAPEQLRTNSTPIGRSVDIWALGVTLYESLAHRRPFESSTREGLYRSILAEDPAPLRSGHHEIPEDLDAIIGKCLEKNPFDRYATALELAEDLHRARMGEPVLARRANLITRFTRFCARSPGIAALLLGSFFVLVASLGVAAVFAKTTSDSANALKNALDETQSEQRLKVLALQKADASLIAAKALALVDRDPAFALALGIEASKRGAGIAADTAMLSALGALNEVRSFNIPGLTEVHHVGDQLVGVVADRTQRRLFIVDPVLGKLGREIGSCTELSVAHNSDELLLITHDTSGSMRASLVHVRTGEVVGLPASLMRGAAGACVSPDGRQVAIWRQDGTFSVRETTMWRETAVGTSSLMIRRIDGSFLDSSTLCFRIAGWIKYLEIHDTSRAAEPVLIRLDELPSTKPVLIGPGVLAVAQNDVVRCYDIRTGVGSMILAGHRGPVTALTPLRRNSMLASSSEDGTIRLWASSTGTAIGVLRGAPGTIRSVTDLGDNQTLVSVSEDSRLTVWDQRVGHPLTAAEFATVRTSRDRILLAASGNNALRGTVVRGFRTMDQWRRGREGISRSKLLTISEFTALSDNGRMAVASSVGSSESTLLSFVDLQAPADVNRWSYRLPGEVIGVHLSPDGLKAAVTVQPRLRPVSETLIIDVKTGSKHSIPSLMRIDGWCAAGTRCVGEFVVEPKVPGMRSFGAVDATTGAVVWKISSSADVVQMAPFSDGLSVAFVTASGAILRASATGVTPLIDRSHRSTPRIRIGHGDTHLITYSDDRDAAVWDVKTGAEVMRIRVGNPVIDDVALTSDGEHLVVGTSDGRVTDWPMNVRAFAESKMPRRLTDADLKIFGLSALPASTSSTP